MQLAQLLASARLRMMKPDDCPHSFAPVLLDLARGVRFAASDPPLGWWFPQPTTLPSGGTVPQGGDILLSTRVGILTQQRDKCPSANVLEVLCPGQVKAWLPWPSSSLLHPLAEVVHQLFE